MLERRDVCETLTSVLLLQQLRTVNRQHWRNWAAESRNVATVAAAALNLGLSGCFRASRSLIGHLVATNAWRRLSGTPLGGPILFAAGKLQNILEWFLASGHASRFCHAFLFSVLTASFHCSRLCRTCRTNRSIPSKGSKVSHCANCSTGCTRLVARRGV